MNNKTQGWIYRWKLGFTKPEEFFIFSMINLDQSGSWNMKHYYSKLKDNTHITYKRVSPKKACKVLKYQLKGAHPASVNG